MSSFNQQLSRRPLTSTATLTPPRHLSPTPELISWSLENQRARYEYENIWRSSTACTMDDASIDALPKDKLVLYVKRLRDASSSLKKERDELEQGKALVMEKAKDLLSRLKDTTVKHSQLTAEFEERGRQLQDLEDWKGEAEEEIELLKSNATLLLPLSGPQNTQDVNLEQLQRDLDAAHDSAAGKASALHEAEQALESERIARANDMEANKRAYTTLEAERGALGVTLAAVKEEAHAQERALRAEVEELRQKVGECSEEKIKLIAEKRALEDARDGIQGDQTRMEQEIQTARASIKEAQVAAERSGRELEQLREQHGTAMTELEKLRPEMASCRDQLSKATSELERVIRNVAEVKEEKETIRDRMTQLEQDCVDLNSRLVISEEEKAVALGRLREAGSEAATAASTTAAASAEVQVLTQARDEALTRLATADAAVLELQAKAADGVRAMTETAEMRAAMAVLEQRCATAEARAVKADGSLAEAQAALAAARAEAALAVDAAKTKCADETTSLKQRLAETQEALQVAQTSSDQSSTRIVELETRVEEAQGSIERLERLISDGEIEASARAKTEESVAQQTSAAMEGLQKQLAALEAEKKALVTEMEALRTSLASAESVKNQVSADLEKLREECGVLTEVVTEVDTQRTELETLTRDLEAKTVRVCELEELVKERGAEIDNVSGTLQHVRGKAAQQKDKILTLKARVSELESMEGRLEESRKALVARTKSEAEAKKAAEAALARMEPLERELVAARAEVASAQALVDGMCEETSARDTRRREARVAVPPAFRVLGRCAEPAAGRGETNVWCLVARCIETGQDGAGVEQADVLPGSTLETGEVLEWYPQTLVESWVAARRSERLASRAAAKTAPLSTAITGASFSIDADDDGDDGDAGDDEDTLPPTVQQSLCARHDKEQAVLTSELGVLKDELASAQSAFEKYRERARENVKRATADQRSVEVALAKNKEDAAIQEQRLREALEKAGKDARHVQNEMEELKSRFEAVESALDKARVELRDERTRAVELSERVLEMEKANRSREASQEAAAASAAVSDSDLAAAGRRVQSLEEEVQELKKQDFELRAQLKKRSETAREMLQEKDAELARLSTQVKAAQAQARGVTATSGIVEQKRSGGGAGGGRSIILPDKPTKMQAKASAPGATTPSSSSLQAATSAGSAPKLVKSVNFVLGQEGGDGRGAQTLGCRMEYVAKAYKQFVLAETAVERASLARVLCQLLGYPPELCEDIVARAKVFISAPLGLEQPLGMPTLDTIERYSIEQLSVENVGTALGSLFGFNSGGQG